MNLCEFCDNQGGFI